MKFSERTGIIKAKDTIQLEYIDEELKNGLYNAFQIFYLDEINQKWISQTRYDTFLKNLWHNFFKLPLDTLDNWAQTTKAQLRDWYFNWEWYEIFDFIEFISKSKSPTDNDKFREFCNGMLEKEISGY